MILSKAALSQQLAKSKEPQEWPQVHPAGTTGWVTVEFEGEQEQDGGWMHHAIETVEHSHGTELAATFITVGTAWFCEGSEVTDPELIRRLNTVVAASRAKTRVPDPS